MVLEEGEFWETVGDRIRTNNGKVGLGYLN